MNCKRNFEALLLQLFLWLNVFKIASTGVGQRSVANFTSTDYAALEKFKQISSELLVDQPEYIKSNEYLVRWIRAKNYDINAARNIFKEALEWRKRNKMDTILQEDFSSISKRYPYWVDGVDYLKRPISTLPMARWDLRRAVLGGEETKVTRYLDQMLEKVSRKALDLLPESPNQIPFQVIIVDVNGFNLRQHVCVSCLPIYFSFITHYESYYPETTGDMFIINIQKAFRTPSLECVKNLFSVPGIIANSPRIFTQLLDIVRPTLSPSIRRAVNVYGHDKAEWSKAILKVVPADQVTPQFGGNKIRK